MSDRPLSKRFLLTFFCALLGAGAGVLVNVLSITNKPQTFRSLAKVVIDSEDGETATLIEDPDLKEVYRTNAVILESDQLQRKAGERMRATHPELRTSGTEIAVRQTKGSGVLNILCSAPEPKQAQIFLNTLIDAFILHHLEIKEKAMSVLHGRFRQEAHLAEQENRRAAGELEKAPPPLNEEELAEHQRLLARLSKMSDRCDDLRMDIQLAESTEARLKMEAKLGLLEKEEQKLAGELAVACLRMAQTETAKAKQDQARHLQEWIAAESNILSDGMWRAAILERATVASEHVENLTTSSVIPAIAGAVILGLGGLLLGIFTTTRAVPPVAILLLLSLTLSNGMAAEKVKKPPCRSTAELLYCFRSIPGHSFPDAAARKLRKQVVLEKFVSDEMLRRAVDRLHSTHADAEPDEDVFVEASWMQETNILVVSATGTEPETVPLFLQALLDEFLMVTQLAQESSQSRLMAAFFDASGRHREEISTARRVMEAALTKEYEDGERARFLARRSRFRDERDDLTLELQAATESDAQVPHWKARLKIVNEELQRVDLALAKLEQKMSAASARTELKKAQEAFRGLWADKETIRRMLIPGKEFAVIFRTPSEAFKLP